MNASSIANLAQDDRVSSALYTDPALFELEMSRIFERTWVWVAHESELPKAGDFRTAWVGRQPVIVSRDRRGGINVLVNRCRHRGASLCEVPKGNGNGFTCPYHAWSYALDGKLRGIPYPDGYEDVLEKKDFGLQRLRVGVYAGMIFAGFNEDVEPLEDFVTGGALHQTDTQAILQLLQGAGERGLADVQGDRGVGDGSLFADRDEGPQVPQLHIHNRRTYGHVLLLDDDAPSRSSGPGPSPGGSGSPSARPRPPRGRGDIRPRLRYVQGVRPEKTS